MRSLFSCLIFFSFFLFWALKPVFACDPIGCLLIGREQDILALVSVTGKEGDIIVVQGEHYYQPSRLRPNTPIAIDFSNPLLSLIGVPEIGEHYFVSLSCADKICTPKWGIWRVDSANYQIATISHIRYGDDAIVQWFMNGKAKEFMSEGDKTFAILNGKRFEIFPNRHERKQNFLQNFFEFVRSKISDRFSLLLGIAGGLSVIWVIICLLRVWLIERNIENLYGRMEKEISAKSGQGRGIPLEIIQGQQEKIRDLHQKQIDRLARKRKNILDKLPLIKR